jgi:hypothetical protein
VKKRRYSQSSEKNKTDQGEFLNANTLELRWMDEKTRLPIKKDKKPIRPTSHARENVFFHNIAVDEDMETYELSELIESNHLTAHANMMELSKMIDPYNEIVEVPPALLAPKVTSDKKRKDIAIIYTNDINNDSNV